MRNKLILIFLVVFLSSCATIPEKNDLSRKDRNLLARWMQMADIASRAEDYRLSCEYYEKIIKEFPDTESAEKAKKETIKLQKILIR